jgi:hypothetical protein
MTKGTPIQVREQEGDLYANHEDFHTIFNEDLKELRPRPSQSNSPLSGAIFPDVDQRPSGSGGHFEMDAVLRLEDSSGLRSSCPSWSTTRNTIAPFRSIPPLEKFGRRSRCRIPRPTDESALC